MPNARDGLVDLMPRKLAAFARLRSLRHLDLKFIRADQILTRHTEPRRGYLFDSAVARVAVCIEDVAGRIFASLSGVAPAADTIHCNGECFMSFLADRTKRHRTRCETLHDRFHRFHFFEWYRLIGVFQIHE